MPYDFFNLSSFIDTAGMIFEGLSGIGSKEKARKLMEDLEPFVGKSVIFRTGKVIRGGDFKVKETYHLEYCEIELDIDTIYIYVNGKEIKREFIEGSTISKLYTGKKGDDRMLINTSGTDYLLELNPSL